MVRAPFLRKSTPQPWAQSYRQSRPSALATPPFPLSISTKPLSVTTTSTIPRLESSVFAEPAPPIPPLGSTSSDLAAPRHPCCRRRLKRVFHFGFLPPPPTLAPDGRSSTIPIWLRMTLSLLHRSRQTF